MASKVDVVDMHNELCEVVGMLKVFKYDDGNIAIDARAVADDDDDLSIWVVVPSGSPGTYLPAWMGGEQQTLRYWIMLVARCYLDDLYGPQYSRKAKIYNDSTV